VADNWTQLGVQIDQQLQSAATIRDLETVARLPGTQVTASLYQLLWTVRFHTREIARPENRWAGNNLSGYSNPVVDTLLDRLATAIAPQEHLALLRDLTSAIQADQPIMPLFWDMNPILALAPVRNLKPYPVLQTTNAYEWDLR
jgi:peptide/nickel transport system substrate-binding protein